MKATEQEFGINARAYFLEQPYGKTTAYGVLKDPEWGQLMPELETRWMDFLNGKLSAQDYGEEATRLIDQRVGPATAGK
jgi:hypothetical protein